MFRFIPYLVQIYQNCMKIYKLFGNLLGMCLPHLKSFFLSLDNGKNSEVGPVNSATETCSGNKLSK